MAQSFSLEEALSGASKPAAAPSKGFSLDDALGASPVKAKSLDLPAGEDLAALITPTEDQPVAERKVYTGSVFDTQPFDPKIDEVEAEKLSRRAYAEKQPTRPRRMQYARATPADQIERSFGRAVADTGIGLLQGAAGIPKGIAANINAGDNPVAAFYEKAIQAGERSKSPYLQSQKAEREALLKTVLSNQGELAQTRAAFTSMFSPAGADVVAQGAGSMLPVVGMSLLNLGQKSFIATNALANAGEAAQNTARELSQMSPQDWSKSDTYQELRSSGLSHADSVRMLAPLMAMPTQLLGGIVGGVSGATGLEKSLAGKGIKGGARERAARAGAELLGEEAETLVPSLAGNITQRLIDEKKSLTEGLGREAVETAFGATPGMALAAAGRSTPDAPKEFNTRGLADRMARERGFLVPETRAERPAPPVRPSPAPDRVEPTFDEETFVAGSTAPKVGSDLARTADDLTQQRAQEQADVIELEGGPKDVIQPKPDRVAFQSQVNTVERGDVLISDTGDEFPVSDVLRNKNGDVTAVVFSYDNGTKFDTLDFDGLASILIPQPYVDIKTGERKMSKPGSIQKVALTPTKKPEPLPEPAPAAEEAAAPAEVTPSQDVGSPLKQRYDKLSSRAGRMQTAARDRVITDAEYSNYLAQLNQAREAYEAEGAAAVELTPLQKEASFIADKLEEAGFAGVARGMRLNIKKNILKTPESLDFYRNKLQEATQVKEQARKEGIAEDYSLSRYYDDEDSRTTSPEFLIDYRARAPQKVRMLTDEAESLMQQLAGRINAAGFKVNDITAITGKDLMPYKKMLSQLAGGASGVVGREVGVRKKYKNSNPESFKKAQESLRRDIETARALLEEEVPPLDYEALSTERAPDSLEVEEMMAKQRLAAQDIEILSKRSSGTSLMKVLEGSLRDGEMSELAGKARQIGKNPFISLVAKKGKRGSSMEDMVDSGKLDMFLPFAMRPGQSNYDNGEAAEYIREQLRNGEFYTDDIRNEIDNIQRGIWEIEKEIEQELTLEDINREIQYAVDEQRALDQETAELAPEGTLETLEESARAEAEEDLIDTPAEEAAPIKDKKVRDKLMRIANNLGVQVFETTDRPLASPQGFINIPAEDKETEGAVTPEHVFAHELGHAIMQKRGMMFNQMPKEQIEKWIPGFASLKEISKKFRPAIWSSKFPKTRRHANKNDEIIADALGSYLLGESSKADIEPLIKGIGLTEYDLGEKKFDNVAEQERLIAELNEKQAQREEQELLKSQTEEELRAKQDEVDRLDKENKRLAKEAEEKAKADERVGDFVLTGSKREADEAAARGQQTFLNIIPKKSAKPDRQIYKDAEAIAAMDEDVRDNMEVGEVPGGPEAYNLYEAKKLLKKPSDKLKRVTDSNSFSLWQDWEYIANIDGDYFGVTKEEDPDAEDGDEDAFIYAYARLDDPRNVKTTFTSDAADLIAEIRADSVRGKPAAMRETAKAPSTDSAAFKRWFGDSKVVDENGEPLVVYHGTDADITTFAPEKSADGVFHFAIDSAMANRFAASRAMDDGRGANVMPVYVSIKKPKRVAFINTPEIEAAKAEGYDGLISESRGHVVAFSPSQIKSATGNIGTYDPENADISKSLEEDLVTLVNQMADEMVQDEKKRSPSLVRTLKTYNRQRRAGKMSEEMYIMMSDAAIRADQERKSKEEPKDRERGYLHIQERLSAAVRRGDLSREAYDLANWFMLQNEGLVADLGVSIKGKGPEGAGGFYNSLSRVITLIKDGGSDLTATHEILHHLERMMPTKVRQAIRKAWLDQLIKAAKTTKDPVQKLYFEAVLDANLGDNRHTMLNPIEGAGKAYADARMALEDMAYGNTSAKLAEMLLIQGAVPLDMYQYFNPSEFWAVNGSRIAQGRYDAVKGGTLIKLKNWLREFGQKIKSLLGLKSDASVIRALDSLIKGDGKFQTDEMLSKADNYAAITGKNVGGRKPLVNWTMPDSTNMDSFIYSIQNKQIDMKRTVDAIKESIGQIDERFDPYMKETLFAGRAATQTKSFRLNELEPLFEEMGRLDVNIPDFEEYLHNRHAQERNEQIAAVNPGMPDKGSGIETADAQAYFANLPVDQEVKYKKLAGMVDAITSGTRQLLVDSGLESQDTIDTWESTYDNYIPLNRDDIDYSSNHGMGVGQGYSVRGPASRRAVGSERKVVDILANIAMQRERNIVRAEKNRVAMAMYGLFIQNPNPDIALAVNPDAKKDIPAATQELVNMGFLPSDIESLMNEPSTMEIDPRTGLAVERVHQMQRGADNVMGLRVNGENRYVFFNQNNERAKRMATAIKNLDADKLGFILSTTADITRFMAALNTQYNPIFGSYNFLRDISTAGLQLTNTPLAGKQKEVLRPSNVWGAMSGIYTDLRAERGGKAGTGQWSKLWEEFQQRGGQTGFRDQFSSTAKRGEALQRIVDPSSWADQGLGRVFTANGTLKVPMEAARKAAAPIFNWLSDYNETMENAIRLSAYKTALDNGMSKDAAAVLAKELTVNFNRKGQIATQAGALYAFFNASVQGTTALARTLSGPAGKKIIAGGLMLGAIQAVLYSVAGFDEGEPPEFIREKSFVIPTINGKYIAIPLPLGYNVIPNTARLITQDVIRFVQGKKVKPVDTAFKVFESLLGAFNPIGNAGWSFQTFAPTLADPFVAIGENKDYTGKNIARKDFNALDPTPGFTRYKESSTAFSRGLAEFMNSMSGGTKDAPGKISPTPDQIDYFIGQIFGGVGREAMKIERTVRSQITGEELPLYSIPFAGRFVGDTKGSSAVSNAFYENLKEMNIHENTVKGMRKRKENVQEYYRENPEARMFEEAGRVEREVQVLRKRRRTLVEKEAPKESVKAIEERITAKMKLFNDKVKKREEKKN